MFFYKSCFRDRGAANQEDWRAGFASVTEGATKSRGLECSCGSRSSTGDRATSSMGDRGTSRCWRMEYLPR
jgi:hypothetical protein